MTTPLVGEVYPNLWVGAKPPLGVYLRDHNTKVLVLCAMEFQPHERSFPGVTVLRCPIDDATLTPGEVMLVKQTAKDVARHVKHGRHTLVTCQMGLNRSALVASLAMIHLGVKPVEAITKVRAKRGQYALCNKDFERMVTRFRPGLR